MVNIGCGCAEGRCVWNNRWLLRGWKEAEVAEEAARVEREAGEGIGRRTPQRILLCLFKVVACTPLLCTVM